MLYLIDFIVIIDKFRFREQKHQIMRVKLVLKMSTESIWPTVCLLITLEL